MREEDRRSVARLPVRDHVPVHYPELEAKLKEISPAGASILDKRTLPPGRTLRLRLPWKNRSVEALAVGRRVAPGVGMGVESIEMDASARETLQQLVANLSSRQNNR